MSEYPPAIAELLAIERTMSLGVAVPDQQSLSGLERISLEELFAPRVVVDVDAAIACLAGLHLYFDDLEGSHKISQDLSTPEGSFWHGIMHRREGDFSNSKYWFRRVVSHPTYPEIGCAVATIDKAPEWALNGMWEPFAFVDLVKSCVSQRPELTELCVKIQQIEWKIMFDFCVRAAINSH